MPSKMTSLALAGVGAYGTATAFVAPAAPATQNAAVTHLRGQQVPRRLRSWRKSLTKWPTTPIASSKKTLSKKISPLGLKSAHLQKVPI